MSIADFEEFPGLLPNSMLRKRKSNFVEKQEEMLLFPSAKKGRWIEKNPKLEHEDWKMEDCDESTIYDGEKETLDTEIPIDSENRTAVNQNNADRLVCKICKKKCINERKLLQHEKIPHFWSCSHSECNLAFASKSERSEHEAVHEPERNSGESCGLDHLVMNADGTMSFNHHRSRKKTGSRHHENFDLSTLVNKSNYGSNKGTSRGTLYCRKRTKNEKWKSDDTEKFYKNLSIYGCNFALLAALFRGRSRKQLKNKFKKEERENPKLIKEALTKRRPMELDINEFEKVVTENMKAKQTETNNNEGANVSKVVEARASQMQREVGNRNVAVEVKRKTSTIAPENKTSVSELKQEPFGLLELGPPSDAEKETMLDDESSDYEFDPFA